MMDKEFGIQQDIKGFIVKSGKILCQFLRKKGKITQRKAKIATKILKKKILKMNKYFNIKTAYNDREQIFIYKNTNKATITAKINCNRDDNSYQN